MISVIGAGPAGSFYASRAAKNNEVHLFEEHRKVGLPVACTGILTDSVRQFVDVKKLPVVSRIERFKIVSPEGKSIYVDLDKVNLVFDRAGFDQQLFRNAVDAGAVPHLGEKFMGYKPDRKLGGYLIRTNKRTYNTNMIVGADGPFSPVARAAGIYGDRKFIWGWQARCKYPNLEPGVTEIRLNLGEFSWIVPEDRNTARVGVIGAKNARLKEDYRKLLGASRIIEDQSGPIPLYNPKQKLRKGKEDIFLLGDAATQVKATTYGGIIYGIIAGSYLAEDKETYVERFNSKLGKDLWISLKMRQLMNNMSERQANDLISIFEKRENKKVLEAHDRDFPSKFIVQLLMKEAKLWKLGFDLFRKDVFRK